MPIYSRGTYLPKRSPLRGGSVLPKRTVESTKKILVYVLASRLLGLITHASDFSIAKAAVRRGFRPSFLVTLVGTNFLGSH